MTDKNLYETLLEKACALSHKSHPEEISVVLSDVSNLDVISAYRVMERIMKNSGIPIKGQREAIAEMSKAKKLNNEFTLMLDEVASFIKKSGNDGVSSREIKRKFFRKESIEGVIEKLIENRLIESRRFKNLRGKPTIMYYALTQKTPPERI